MSRHQGGSIRLSATWISALAVAQFGLWVGLYAPLKTLVPLLADQLSGSTNGGKEALLAGLTLAGSLVALVANPLAGALSDRSGSRWGPRRPWILAGALLAAVNIALLPQAAAGMAVLVLWCFGKLGLNACMAALNGAVADQVLDAQQGRLWGWVGLAQPLGLVLGVGLSALLLPQLQLAAFSQGALVLLCCLPALLVIQGQRRLPRPSPLGQAPLAAFADRPVCAL